jgi:hypothetical protein
MVGLQQRFRVDNSPTVDKSGRHGHVDTDDGG